MRKELKKKLNLYQKERSQRNKRRLALSALSLIVVVSTALALMLPAITMETICGLETHQHGPECYSTTEVPCKTELLCGFETSDTIVLHTHDEYCYGTDGTLVCPLPEIVEHLHSDECFTEVQRTICNLDESLGHVHSSSCYSERVLICTQEELAAHKHHENCYENPRAAVCGLQEDGSHRHTEDCFDNPRTPICDQQHEHGENCFENPRAVICDLVEGPGHSHTDACFTGAELICELAEGEGSHTHDDSCFELEFVQICEKEIVILHIHTEECIDGSCGMQEVIAHQHTADCIRETEGFTEHVLICQISEHSHTPECYPDKGTTCGIKAHTHNESCFEENGDLICEKQEHEHLDECMEVVTDDLNPSDTEATDLLSGVEVHAHNESCLDENGDLICEKQEHEHPNEFMEVAAQDLDLDDTETAELLCGMENHSHSEFCFSENGELICEQPEHEHSDECLTSDDTKEQGELPPEIIPGENENYVIDPYAHSESAEYIEDALSHVVLTGDWSKDVLAIAKSQLGYRESTTDFEINEEGRKKGYTYYGEWYGIPYGDWCAMFVSFCLDTADVQEYPLSAGCQSWIDKLAAKDVDMWHPASDPVTGERYMPKPGDLVFYDFDLDGLSDHVGLVYELIGTSGESPALLRTIEGNYGDMVCLVTHAQEYVGIMGYGELPKNPDLAEDEKVESDISLQAELENGVVVTVTGPESSFPENIEDLILTVREVLPETATALEAGAYEQLMSYISDPAESVQTELIRIFDITLLLNDAEVNLLGPVSVTVTGIEGSAPSVYHVTEAAVEELSSEQAAEGEVVFDTTHFSLFGIVTGSDGLLAANRGTTSFKVNKSWSDYWENHGPVTMTLMQTDASGNTTSTGQTATLSSSNNWSYTFTGLNDSYTYSVVESPVSGYTTRYGEIQQSRWSLVPDNQLVDGHIYAFCTQASGALYLMNAAGGWGGYSLQPYSYNPNIPASAQFTAIASGNGFKLYNAQLRQYLNGNTFTANANAAPVYTFADGKLSCSTGYMYFSPTWTFLCNGNANTASTFMLYEHIPYETTVFNSKIIETPVQQHAEPTIHKTIDYLGDGESNPDTSLTGADFYRLNLDLQTEQEPIDLLIVADITSSMSRDLDPGISRQTVLDQILNGTLRNGQRDTDGLIYNFLSMHPDNMIAVTGFYGGWNNTGDTYEQHVGTFNSTLLNWTSQENSTVNIVLGTDAGTNYASGLRHAEDMLQNPSVANNGHPKVMVFLTDGGPNNYLLNGVYMDERNYPYPNTRDYFVSFVHSHPNMTSYLVGISRDATEEALLMDIESGCGGALTYYPADSAAELRNALQEIIEQCAPARITDELSAYVQIANQADLKVVWIDHDGVERTVWSGGTGTSDNMYNGVPIISTVAVTSSGASDSTGKVEVIFNAACTLVGNNTFTLSYNVELTEYAKQQYVKNGYSGVEGDENTDFPGNVTSSEKPGLHSNKEATAGYSLHGEEHELVYPHPVVQTKMNLVVTKTVVGVNSTERFTFVAVIRDEDDNIVTSIPSGQGYAVDPDTGEITFSLANGESVTILGLLREWTVTVSETSHDGYTVLIKDGNQTLTVGDNSSFVLSEHHDITVLNNAGTVLPETGGTGTLPYTLCGTLIMLAAVMYGCRWRKRERRSAG